MLCSVPSVQRTAILSSHRRLRFSRQRRTERCHRDDVHTAVSLNITTDKSVPLIPSATIQEAFQRASSIPLISLSKTNSPTTMIRKCPQLRVGYSRKSEEGQQHETLSLRDDQWERIKNLLAGRPCHVGVTTQNNRRFVEAVFHRYQVGIAWRDLPQRLGHWKAEILSKIVYGRRGASFS